MDTFLKIIDKLISLIKAREEKREENKAKIFNQIIEPLHQEFEKVVVQYFAFFRTMLAGINDKLTNDESTLNLLTQLKEQRNEYIQARIKIVSMSEAIKSMGNSDVLEYCENIKAFFFIDRKTTFDYMGGSLEDNLERIKFRIRKKMGIEESIGLNMLKMMELEEKCDDSATHEAIIFIIEDSIKNMEESWASVSSLYAKMRVNYLISKQR